MPKAPATPKKVKPFAKSKKRLFQAYVTEQTLDDATRLITAKGITKSAFLEAALRMYLDDMSQIDALFRRLDRQTRLLGKLTRHQEFVAEMFSTYLQYWFAHTPELGDSEKRPAKLASQRRYQAFLDYVAQRLATPEPPDQPEESAEAQEA
ncbi:MAG: hypothetical protein GKS05_13300 [Nitrospirales bacterium]|nr:hypothetical protein [Nitrospirales bacterium]NKB82830.1 hypothetical protein [Nitrospirales bacterium]